jgi:ATP phosphoribosyltransferase regulatory subunit
MAETLLKLFDRWGYERMVTPLFELAEVFERGLGADARAATIRFVEPGSGEVVALRPDITPQIARIAATYPLASHGPARICYDGQVSRESKRPGGARDQLQAGIELIGPSGFEADVEVASIAAAALSAIGVAEYHLELGHVALVRTVLSAVPMRDRSRLEKALAEKDQSTVATIARGLNRGLMALCQALPTLCGAPETVFREVQSLPLDIAARAELDAFAKTVERVTALHPEARRGWLSVDLGEVRGFHYYTGIRLFGYIAGVGQAVLRGGRYDELVGQYGQSAGATGFAVDIEAIADAQAKAGVPSSWRRRGVLLLCNQDDWMRGQSIASLLRKKDVRVAAGLRDDYRADTLDAYAEHAGFHCVLILEGGAGRIVGGDALTSAVMSKALSGDVQELINKLFGSGECRA